MAILKNKIRLAQQAVLMKRLAEAQAEALPTSKVAVTENGDAKQAKARLRAPKSPNTSKTSNTKNMSINYGKAIISFSTSSVATPYLKDVLQKHGLTRDEFVAFVTRAKESIGGMSSLRSLLLVFDSDSEQVVALKSTFRYISEVFIKYFSVNWIIHGKVTHKMTYLQYRFKMLRRIQDPEHFTYIRERKTSSKSC